MKPFTLNPVVLHGSNHFFAKMFDAHKAPKPQTATLNWNNLPKKYAGKPSSPNQLHILSTLPAL